MNSTSTDILSISYRARPARMSSESSASGTPTNMNGTSTDILSIYLRIVSRDIALVSYNIVWSYTTCLLLIWMVLVPIFLVSILES